MTGDVTSASARPLEELTTPVTALLTDLDGTMTTAGVIEPATYAALHDLVATGVPVVIVTGRPAGWGHLLASSTGATAVIAENGGVTLRRVGGQLAIDRVPVDRTRLRADVEQARAAAPGLAYADDDRYRDVDVALDWNEHARVPAEVADGVVTALQARGWAASRSNVHINVGPPGVDKGTAIDRLLPALGLGGAARAGVVYVGDSANDGPAFGVLAQTVGVANVRAAWPQLVARPRFVTRAPEGAGLREVCAHLRALVAVRQPRA